jgi:hypothetical protein
MTRIDRSQFAVQVRALEPIESGVSRAALADLETLKYQIATMGTNELVRMPARLDDPRAVVTCVFAFNEVDRRARRRSGHWFIRALRRT